MAARPAAPRDPDAPKPLDKKENRPNKWRQRMDAVTTLSPRGIGLVSGLIAFAITENKLTAIGFFVAGQAAETAKDIWGLREKRRKEKQDGN